MGPTARGECLPATGPGDFLYEQLYRAGFANQPHSKRADDGLILKDALISAAIRCAPPANKPLPEEIRNCLPYLERELALIRPRAILALGGIALNTYLDLLKRQGLIASRAAYPFAHGASFVLPGDLPRLFAAYHPSQQNTQTGRLTPAMFARVLQEDSQIFGKDCKRFQVAQTSSVVSNLGCGVNLGQCRRFGLTNEPPQTEVCATEI